MSSTAILISIALPDDNTQDVDDSLRELESLVVSCDFKVVDTVVQRRKKFDATTLVGDGKLDEIVALANEKDVDLLVFDQALNATQTRNIEKRAKRLIVDRTAVILNIFERHAKTKAARTQVEIAKLEYQLNRLAGRWTHLERVRGGKGGLYGKGMGEKQIEIDRRILRERISRLKKSLGHVRTERMIQCKQRNSVLKVALVGYTNVGKTQIMNALTTSGFIADDNLFVTLDPKIRTLDPNTRPKILISDTVGFIKKLPHGLVESFKSTLEEVTFADLLLHVVDLSHERFEEQIAITEEVLEEIGAKAIPILYVFNKVDRLPESERFLPRIVTGAHVGSIAISALNEDDIIRLRSHVFDYFAEKLVVFTARFSYDQGEGIAFVKRVCIILDTEAEDESIVYHAKTTDANLIKLKRLGAIIENLS